MGSESLDDTDATLEQQVAVNSDNITRLFVEHERMRERLHGLEADRATVLLLAQKLDNLALALPEMVNRAADKAAERVNDATKGDIRTYAALVSALVAAATLLYLVFH